MKSNKLQVIVFCLVSLCAIFVSSSAKADTWDKATKLTFTEPVEIPGRALASGTYWFELADSTSNRHIVRVWNADRSEVLATILAVPDYRLQPTGDTVIKFSERPTGTPEAIKAWFYPGDNFGQEFVYPKAKATQLAQQEQHPVLSLRDEQVAAPAPVLKQAPVEAVQATGEEVEITEVIDTVAAPEALPSTASPLPLLGLLGLVSLCAGLMLRRTSASDAA
jgi:hypothetical protein